MWNHCDIFTIVLPHKKLHSPLTLTTTLVTLFWKCPQILWPITVFFGVRGWVGGWCLKPLLIILPVIVATHKKIQINLKYTQWFVNRPLHSEIYMSFTHYFHLPHLVNLVVTWCHHTFHAAHPCATCLHAAHPCTAHPCAAPLRGGCSPSSWLKT